MKREIIAILRGIKPNEVLAVAHSIADSGITQIEVPMNSPDVFDSIKLLCDEFRDDIQIGAGTVTNTQQVEILSDIGGVRFIVSPNFDSEVVEATKKMGMMSFPGVITPHLELSKFGPCPTSKRVSLGGSTLTIASSLQDHCNGI